MKPVANPNEPTVANFVQKAYEIINGNQHNKIIGWMPNGKEFGIKDIDQFQQTILPKYFRHRNINSFIRQLNMYGFHKSRKEPSKNIFSHPFFQKDKADQLIKVKRKIKNDQNQTPKKFPKPEKESEKSVILGEKPTAQKEQHQPLSSGSIPFKSSECLQKQIESPLKGFISRSFIMDIDPEICLNNENPFMEENISSESEEGAVSIADEIERERIRFNNRTRGISIVKTTNFLQEFQL